MYLYDKLSRIDEIKEKMQDEESKRIFKARVEYMINKQDDLLIESIYPFLRNMCCPDLRFAMDDNQEINQNIIIFGSGHDGIMTKAVLEVCGYSAISFCDSDENKIGTVIDGLPVISKKQLIEECQNCLVILASRIYISEMYNELVEIGFPVSNIVVPRLKILCGAGREQYFDVFKSEDSEVFVDAGAYNGNTVEAFMDWTNKKYKKIYVMEPLGNQYKYIEQRCKANQWKNVFLYNNAAWDKCEKLNFFDNDTGSRVVENNTGLWIQGCTIDSIVKDEKVTYIKMDIEGSELRALEGARNTICKNTPKLAISIYHKYEDIIELPLKILELNKEYKFYLRHYSTNKWETVLYACI